MTSTVNGLLANSQAVADDAHFDQWVMYDRCHYLGDATRGSSILRSHKIQYDII